MADITWLDRYFVSAFVLDPNGVATLSPTETATSGDPLLVVRGKYGSQSTPDATVRDVILPWSVALGSAWAIEAYVTVRSTATINVRQKIKISGLVYGAAGPLAALDAAPDVDSKGTGTATAAIVVTGTSIILRLSPVASVQLVWGYEIRAQQL